MFWDKVAGIYDLFGNVYNGKVDRELCRGVASEIGPEDTVLDRAGADFRQDFTYETYRAFFEEAGYRNVRTKLIDGRVPCALAVITKEV